MKVHTCFSYTEKEANRGHTWAHTWNLGSMKSGEFIIYTISSLMVSLLNGFSHQVTIKYSSDSSQGSVLKIIAGYQRHSSLRLYQLELAGKYLLSWKILFYIRIDVFSWRWRCVFWWSGIWHSVIWRCRQFILSKHLCLPTTLHSIIHQTTKIEIMLLFNILIEHLMKSNLFGSRPSSKLYGAGNETIENSEN